MQISLFHGSCSTHAQYELSCAGLEQLRIDHGDRCRLCGRATKHMNIDHDHLRGWGAVRGLLCARCNGTCMRRVDDGDWPITAEVREYLISPWHLSGERLPYEPQVSVSVAELSQSDRSELYRLHQVPRTSCSVGKERPAFEHQGVAAGLANRDLRPVLRLLWMSERGLNLRDITT